MENNTKTNPMLIVKGELEKIRNKEFKVFFYTIDSKGAANNYLVYIYETAYQLKEMGYDVHMLHQEDDFYGVETWMGEKYSSLPHHNVMKDKVDISMSDVLFIPEFYSNVMSQTKNLPCKRVVILQNMSYMTYVIPHGATWAMYGIKDCICKTDRLSKNLSELFPYVNSRVIKPFVDEDLFSVPTKPKKLMVNVVAKNESDVNNIVKQFFWKYPMYKFVAFRDLRNIARNDFAECLKEAAITVWVDRDTEFGCSALEAMKCRSIVIGKVTDNENEWMFGDGKFVDNGVWYFNDDDVHTLIAGAIESFIKDGMNPLIYDEMAKFDDKYTKAKFIEDIKRVYIDDIFKAHEEEVSENLKRLEEK